MDNNWPKMTHFFLISVPPQNVSDCISSHIIFKHFPGNMSLYLPKTLCPLVAWLASTGYWTLPETFFENSPSPHECLDEALEKVLFTTAFIKLMILKDRNKSKMSKPCWHTLIEAHLSTNKGLCVIAQFFLYKILRDIPMLVAIIVFTYGQWAMFVALYPYMLVAM